VPTRDPHIILGVRPGASAASIKAAWRRLARENHPDLTGDDPAASRRATRRMAEINDAYEILRRADAERRAGLRPEPSPTRPGWAAAPDAGEARRGGPPGPRPTRPVTGRVDTSATFRPHNSTTTPRVRLVGQPPLRADRVSREPPRASDPTGPLERARLRHFRRPPAPPLEQARLVPMAFGKFRGHTLAEIAAFEPSYIDWLAATITRDPDLVAAARVVQEDLDRRGVARRRREPSAPIPDGAAGRTA
jgi:curved DNA-binding protein CbpA